MDKDTNINPMAASSAASNPTANMFSRFQQHHRPPLQYQPIHLQPQAHRNFPLRDSQTSEEADSSTANIKKPRVSGSAEDGETIEVVRRPKGRPPGSKNKTKTQTTTSRPQPPIHPNTTPISSMFPYLFEIPGGIDIITSLTGFTRMRGTGISILTATGSVAGVTLAQPGGLAISFQGRFEMLALSALLLPVAVGNLCGGAGGGGGMDLNGVFTVSLAGTQGQVVGGRVVGPLVAAGTVYIVAAGFVNPTYHRINPADQQEEDSGEVPINSASPDVSGGGGCEGGTAAVMYGGHLGSASSSDVIWAPTARPPHQHPPPPY